MKAVYSAKTKAGRAWISKILESATRVSKIEIDLLTEERTSEEFPIELLRQFIEIDGRSAVLHQIENLEYVYLMGAPYSQYVTKYVIRTYAFDVSDLPIV